MNHTPQIRRAIQFAAKKHHGQMRRGAEPLPYVTHLFSVALLAAESGANDDVVTAALLHDTIEDTGTTREEIVVAFNEHVAELVESVSEIRNKGGVELGWTERKMDYIARLEHASVEAVLIAVADKVDNIESRLEGFAREGESFFANFGRPHSDYLWFHGEVLRIVQARAPKHPLTKRLRGAHARELEVFTGK